MTVRTEEKSRLSIQALQDAEAGPRIMRQYGIDYLLRPLVGMDEDPYAGKAGRLKEVYGNPAFRIYRPEETDAK
jgi:hypothetical protein